MIRHRRRPDWTRATAPDEHRATGAPGGSLRDRWAALHQLAGNRAVGRLLRQRGRLYADPTAVAAAHESPSTSLPDAVRADMEARFDRDLSAVRVHTGARSADAAHDLGAKAFTAGDDIAFARGEYDPSSGAGRERLAHELLHIVQGVGRHGGRDLRVTSPTGAAERDARAAAAGERVNVTAAPAAGVARDEAPASAPAPMWVELVDISRTSGTIDFYTTQGHYRYPLAHRDLNPGLYYVEVATQGSNIQFELPEGHGEFEFQYPTAAGLPDPSQFFPRQSVAQLNVTDDPAPPLTQPATAEPSAGREERGGARSLEDVVAHCEANDVPLKTFPFRPTRFGAAVIWAEPHGDKIRVRMPFHTWLNDDFSAQIRTLGGKNRAGRPIDLDPNEVVRLHTYEPRWYHLNITGSTSGDVENEFCLTGAQMLEVAAASRRATYFNIALTGFEVATFFVPVGKVVSAVGTKVVRPGLTAAMIGTADVAPTAFAGITSRAGTVIVEQQATTQVVGQAVNQTVAHTIVPQTVAKAVVPASQQAATAIAGTQAAVEIAGKTTLAATADVVGSQALKPIAGASEVTLSAAEYQAALRLTFPAQYLNPIAIFVDQVGRRAAARAVADPRFVAAVNARNWTLAGTLFHSAAATEARAAQATLGGGWIVQAERVIQAGTGGSRADLLFRGPGGVLAEVDWKTTVISGLSTASRSEMTRHAGQITVNIGGTLVSQESRSWVELVKAIWPGNWP